jgi:hypothetical protein
MAKDVIGIHRADVRFGEPSSDIAGWIVFTQSARAELLTTNSDAAGRAEQPK